MSWIAKCPLSIRTIDNSNDSRKKYGPKGEGPNHKALKEWILEHPEGIGLIDVVGKHLEYEFVTGDRADIVFDLRNGRHAVVEIETSDPYSIMIGAHQALKYRVLKNAEIGAEIGSDKVSSFLVAGIEPEDLQFCLDYKISFVKKNL